jgi:acetoacetyl-CoA synthetase
MLALAALSQGIVWSSCSPDFGVEGVLERFGQIEPKVLFCADGYRYNGETHDSLERVAGLVEKLPSVRKVVVVPHLDPKVDVSEIPKAVTLGEWLRRYTPGDIAFAQLPFDHPVFILFTSGTTGKPKCIVHGAGGTLLQALKMFKLHFDLRPGERYFYYCTTNWVVWNLLFMALAAEASVMLYDGSPFARNGRILFDYRREGAHHPFRHLGQVHRCRGEARPAAARHARPGSVRMILSTGSPLAPEGFDYVYDAVKSDACLASISGGTDIMGAFADASAVLPVYRGELQCRSLGMAVEVFDEEANSVVGKKGELVCTKPFPFDAARVLERPRRRALSLGLLRQVPGVWTHGDWSELTERGTMLVYGRSDATLNPGGVRIGTAEIYRVVERIDEVEEAVAIGQLWPPEQPTDTRVVLFVKLRDGQRLEDHLEERIRFEIRRHASPRHVPARIVQVDDIPRTKNGKVVELAVKAVVHGMPVTNTDALANPEALELFRDLPELPG